MGMKNSANIAARHGKLRRFRGPVVRLISTSPWPACQDGNQLMLPMKMAALPH